ncbi:MULTISPECIES: ATP synthase F1 subunit delta [Lacrimispora]|jgi:F-type H+-transporting ATPase subunit delta|uniref:ATP synthase F1 subunit delta n=1 Tax=Lacrimispora TaxID=2719231 RepID=UPI000BE239C3|nr:ATP synthase F1 subunit delta [Lacrimispora amygdalina]MDK2965248.1 F-type H+-transporting ATPase subunit delta [Lacrimispora sp.]
MKQAAINYGQVLYELSLPEKVIEDTALALKTVPELKRVLNSPVIPKTSKHRVIDRVFDEPVRVFLKVLVDRRDMELAEDIFEAWRSLVCKEAGILEASLTYVTKPDEEQMREIKAMLCRKYEKKEVRLRLIEDPGLIGGFILRVGDVETDWSLKGRLRQLEQNIMRR